MIIDLPDKTPITEVIKLAAELGLQRRLTTEGGFTTQPKPPTSPKVAGNESARRARV